MIFRIALKDDLGKSIEIVGLDPGADRALQQLADLDFEPLRALIRRYGDARPGPDGNTEEWNAAPCTCQVHPCEVHG